MRHRGLRAATALTPAWFGVPTNLVTNPIQLSFGWQMVLTGVLVALSAFMVNRALRPDRTLDPSHDTGPAAQDSRQLGTALPDPRRRFVGRPPPRAAAFQKRQAAAKLSATLASKGTAVLRGTGGVGKTQLAADYADKIWNSQRVDVLLWIKATSRDEVLRRLNAAAVEIFGGYDHDARRAGDRVLGWLAATELRWLVVFDDLRDPRDLDDLWPHRTPFGMVLVTTRRRDEDLLTGGGQAIDVGPFTLDESVRYLTERLRPRQADGAEELAEELGRLPEALARAAAHIADNSPLTCGTYRLPAGRDNPVASTWTWSVSEANRTAPSRLARPLLALVALLDPRGVPEKVFTSTAVRIYLCATGWRVVDAEKVRNVLSLLDRFSLITYDPTTPDRAVRAHSLVQRAVYESLTRSEVAAAARAAANALLQVWPTVDRDRSQASVLRDNVAALRKMAGAHLWSRGVRAVLFRHGHSLGQCGNAEAARNYFWELVCIARAERGQLHPATLRARACHAHWQGEAGDPKAAAATLKALLLAARQKFGSKHQFTLCVCRNYARWLSDAGDPVSAVELMTKIVPDFIRILGPAHKDTLYARNILVRVLGDAGQPGVAVELMQKLVADFDRILSASHPDTISARNNLAVMRYKADDPARAVAELTELIEIVPQVFGPENPKTLLALDNLAHALGNNGDR